MSPYCSETDEASFNATESERQRANHNPRVGGSSPSSGIRGLQASPSSRVDGVEAEDVGEERPVHLGVGREDDR